MFGPIWPVENYAGDGTWKAEPNHSTYVYRFFLLNQYTQKFSSKRVRVGTGIR